MFEICLLFILLWALCAFCGAKAAENFALSRKHTRIYAEQVAAIRENRERFERGEIDESTMHEHKSVIDFEAKKLHRKIGRTKSTSKTAAYATAGLFAAWTAAPAFGFLVRILWYSL